LNQAISRAQSKITGGYWEKDLGYTGKEVIVNVAAFKSPIVGQPERISLQN
jgi:hypothetical protein